MVFLVLGNRRKNRLRSFLRKAAVVVAVLVLILGLCYTAFRQWTRIVPPVDSGAELPRGVGVEVVNGVPRMSAGKSWMERSGGLWRIHLAGGPREMGHGHGLLARRIFSEIDRRLLSLSNGYLNSASLRLRVGNLVRWRFRHLPGNIPPMRVVELAAFSRTMLDTPDAPESPYHRLVYYHALQDISQRMEGLPLLRCTAFAMWGKKTVKEHMIIGRTLDFEGGDIFDREKAIISFHPKERIPFVSISWPGQMGVYTGINAKQIYASINAARTDDPLRPGIPLTLLVREIMENASDLKEAQAMIKERQVMAPAALLLADGKVSKAVVVELSPGGHAVRRSSGGILGLTNHFLDKRFKGDASNHWLKRHTTSQARYQRLMQLLRRFAGRIDAKTAAMILRNRTGVDDEPLGLGNRNALDALTSAYGVVADLSEMVLWVSRGPHLLGSFAPVDLKPLLGLPVKLDSALEPIAADPLLGSARHGRYGLARSQMAGARRLREQGDLQAAVDLASRAVSMQPESVEAHTLIADLLWQRGQREKAKEHYRQVLELHPPRVREMERIKNLLQ